MGKRGGEVVLANLQLMESRYHLWISNRRMLFTFIIIKEKSYKNDKRWEELNPHLLEPEM